MKLNAKDPNRTLHVHEMEGHFLLIERERSDNRYRGRKVWDEARVILSQSELRRLYENFHTILGGFKPEGTHPMTLNDRIRASIKLEDQKSRI